MDVGKFALGRPSTYSFEWNSIYYIGYWYRKRSRPLVDGVLEKFVMSPCSLTDKTVGYEPTAGGSIPSKGAKENTL